MARGDAQGQPGLPVAPGPVAISQGPVQEGLHLGGNIEDIDRGGQDNGISLQDGTDHRVVIVPDPAGAGLQAGGAAGAEADLVLTQKNLLQFQPLPGQVFPQHGQHLGGVAEAFVRGAVDGHHVVVLGHAILLFPYFSGRASLMPPCGGVGEPGRSAPGHASLPSARDHPPPPRRPGGLVGFGLKVEAAWRFILILSCIALPGQGFSNKVSRCPVILDPPQWGGAPHRLADGCLPHNPGLPTFGLPCP